MGKRVSGYNGCMEFFLNDESMDKKPPAETRLLNMHAEPSSDGKRLKVVLSITPFEQRPYLDLALTDSKGVLIVASSIVEPINSELELNLHIRKALANPGDELNLTAIISYPDIGEVDRQNLAVRFPFPAV